MHPPFGNRHRAGPGNSARCGNSHVGSPQLRLRQKHRSRARSQKELRLRRQRDSQEHIRRHLLHNHPLSHRPRGWRRRSPDQVPSLRRHILRPQCVPH